MGYWLADAFETDGKPPTPSVIEFPHPNTHVDNVAAILLTFPGGEFGLAPFVFHSADQAERFLDFSEVDFGSMQETIRSYRRWSEVELQGWVSP